MNTCPRCGFQQSASGTHCLKCGNDLRRNTSGHIGQILLDKYRIEEHLGEGGMCDVYRATHLGMGKEVAIKILKPALASDEAISRRFEQEARAASRIHHPHAINVMDYGISDGHTAFIVMEFVKGVTIGELLRKHGALPVERTANILRQVCGALDMAHSVGVVHRDIKPDNIIIAEYDGSDWVEVVDFGVAKIQEDVNRRGDLTGANIIVGTPRYMSPEQCEEKPVDARSDIYSLGVVLYEMLSGEAPFKGDSSTRLLVAHASEPPVPLGEKRPDLPADLVSVVMQALEKDPDKRPQSAGEFARRFEEAAGLGQPAQARARRGAFSRILVPLGDDESRSALAASDSTPNTVDDTLDDEETVVRARGRSDSVPTVNTPAFQNADTPYDQHGPAAGGSTEGSPRANEDHLPHAQAYQTPARGVTYVAHTPGYRGRSNTGGVIALVSVVLIVAGIAAYLVFGNRLFGPGSTSEAVIEAQQAVTEALTRVDMLPKDHPLRTYTSDLSQWQGELRAYQEIQENNSQVTDKAERYRQKAEDISNQARSALLALGREPANASPAHAAPPADAAAKEEAARKAAEGEGAAAPGEGGDEAESEAETKADAKPETETEEGSANANKSRPRRAEPPVIDPVKPENSDSGQKNSNARRGNKPPMMDKVNRNEGGPDGGLRL
jgi:eukaryotic-like serine/threonine-protein kinase